MIPFIKYIRVFILLLPLLLGACIKEDTSGCIQGGYICFIPENPKHYYPDLVRSVDLYFYNETGDLATELSYAKEDLRPGDMAAFVKNIPDGKYTMVSLINDVESYRTVNTGRLESIKSFLVKEISDNLLVDFFSGIREITVAGDMPEEIPVDIFKHNNNIYLEIILDGYEISQGSNLNSFIEGNNGAYEYLFGTCPEASFRSYLPYSTQEDQNGITLAFNFCVMRLWRESDLYLYLKEIDASENLVQSMSLNIAGHLVKIRNEQGLFLYDTNQKLSFHDDYKIAIRLGPDFILLELRINDWWIIGGGVEV